MREVDMSVQLCALNKKNNKKNNNNPQLSAVCCALYHTDASRQVEVFPPPFAPLIVFFSEWLSSVCFRITLLSHRHAARAAGATHEDAHRFTVVGPGAT